VDKDGETRATTTAMVDSTVLRDKITTAAVAIKVVVATVVVVVVVAAEVVAGTTTTSNSAMTIKTTKKTTLTGEGVVLLIIAILILLHTVAEAETHTLATEEDPVAEIRAHTTTDPKLPHTKTTTSKRTRASQEEAGLANTKLKQIQLAAAPVQASSSPTFLQATVRKTYLTYSKIVN